MEKDMLDFIKGLESHFCISIICMVEGGGRQLGIWHQNSDCDYLGYFMPKERKLYNNKRISIHAGEVDIMLHSAAIWLEQYEQCYALAETGTLSEEACDVFYLPFVYTKSPVIMGKERCDRWGELLQEVFPERTAMEFYQRKSRINMDEIFMFDKTQKYMSVRRLLYAYRSVLSGIWLRMYHTIPPTRLKELLPMFSQDTAFVSSIEKILELYHGSKSNKMTLPTEEALITRLQKLYVQNEEWKDNVSADKIEKKKLQEIKMHMKEMLGILEEI